MATEAGAWERLAKHTSTSSQALRAYLDGQSAYRRGGYRDAIRFFRRALEIDASFAMAGLGLANAAERINALDERSRGLAVAWTAREDLIDRDRVYLAALVGPRYPAPSPEREQLSAWERAAAQLPDRADVWHGLGARLFYDGRLLGIADWQTRAASAFRRAADLDPRFASPLQFLVQLAATAGDTSEVRRAAAAYLRLDSIGDLAGFVKWRAAIALSDSGRLRGLRRALPSQPTASLRAIVLSSQYNGIGLLDAERALAVLRDRAVRAAERRDLQFAAHALALNRGQPSLARQALLELEATQPFSDSRAASRLRVLDALYGEGDPAQGSLGVSRLRSHGRSDRSSASVDDDDDRCVAAQWDAWHASPRAAGADTTMGRSTTDLESTTVCDALAHAIDAVQLRRPDAAALLTQLDSLVSFGPPLGAVRGYVHLAMARLYAAIGDSARASIVVRRRPHMQEWPDYLAVQLREEGRLLTARRDSTEALRAYRLYLALRTSPEAAVRPEVDEVRAEVLRDGVRP
jgi:tetratricopeptide (TPR) repeat protein